MSNFSYNIHTIPFTYLPYDIWYIYLYYNYIQVVYLIFERSKQEIAPNTLAMPSLGYLSRMFPNSDTELMVT